MVIIHMVVRCTVLTTQLVAFSKMQYIPIIIVLSLQDPVAPDVSRRVTRLIGGDRILDQDRKDAPFKALEYYVWIGEAWDTSREFWINVCRYIPPCLLGNVIAVAIAGKLCFLEKPERLACGGALIAPNVVQTACHCVAEFVFIDGKPFSHFVIRNNWEEQMFIYMGTSNVRAFKYPIRTYRFHAHEKCAKKTKTPTYNRYDIGWIVLEEDVDQSEGMDTGNWGTLDYAGPYRYQRLKDFSLRVIAQRQVCLVLGYGYKQENGITKSTNIKYGWVQIIDWQNCYDATWGVLPQHQNLPYNQSATWTCYQPLHSPYLGVLPRKGDSGGPITCSNNYFALVSSYHKYPSPQAGFQNMSLGIPIYYAPEANTVENRKKFQDDLYLWGTYRYRHGPPDELRAISPNRTTGYPIRRLGSNYYDDQFRNPRSPGSSSDKKVPLACFLYFLKELLWILIGKHHL